MLGSRERLVGRDSQCTEDLTALDTAGQTGYTARDDVLDELSKTNEGEGHRNTDAR
jgi:hypothetical protein